jgi:hypothetical protein
MPDFSKAMGKPRTMATNHLATGREAQSQYSLGPGCKQNNYGTAAYFGMQTLLTKTGSERS